MKKVGVCVNCGRTVYTNDLDLCKRCYNLVGVELEKKKEAEEGPEEEETGPSMEELGLAPAEGEAKEEEAPEEKEEEKPAEEEKKEEAPAEEKKEEKKE